MPTMPYSRRLGDPPDAADVAGAEVGRETELGVVGHGDGLLLGAEADQRRHRPEDLLAEDPHVGRDPGEDGGLEEAAAELRAAAAEHDLGALGSRVLDHGDYVVGRGVVDQRAHRHAVLGAVAELELPHRLGQLSRSTPP